MVFSITTEELGYNFRWQKNQLTLHNNMEYLELDPVQMTETKNIQSVITILPSRMNKAKSLI
jgi:hypothetical protein